MPNRFDMTIGGADVTCRIGTLNISETLNGRNTLTCEVLSLDAAYRPTVGEEHIVEDTNVRTFGGNINTPSEHVIDDQLIEEFATTVSSVDFNAIADRITVIGGGFPAGFNVKQALTSLAGYLAPYGVTVDPAQVNGPVLPLMQYDVKRVSAWFDEITVITGFPWEIDYTKVVRFIDPGTLAAPFNVADDDGHTVGDIVVEPSDVDYANRVIVLAGTGQKEVTEALTFNGVDDFIDLTYTLVSHRGYLTVNGNNEPLGGSPAFWVFDPLIPNRIRRDIGVPAAGVGEIIYTAQFPYIAQADDAVAQLGPRGVVDTVITKTDVFEATLAQALAEGYLNRMVAEPSRIRYTTFTSGLHPGQTQTIQSSVRGINLTALITDVQARDIDGETMRYEITAVEGNVYPGSWRDMYREWTGTGGGASSSGGAGLITVVSSGGVGGSGTAGSLAQWITPATLGDATAVPAALLTGTIAAARLPQFTGGDVVSSGAGSVALNIAAGVIVNTDINAAAAIAWTKIDKTGSSLADLTTRSAGDLTSGNLAYARMPTGSGTWTATPTISGTITVGADVLVSTGYFSNIGALTKKFLTLHCAELWVETLVAQNTIATIGGRVLVGPTNILTVDAGTGATSLTFKYNNFANGDRIYFEANGAVEWMAVTSGPSGSAGAYVYTVTRNLDGSGANAWTAGDAAFNTGTTGKGFIDLYSTSGVLSGSGPTIVGNVRTGTTYSDIAPRWAVGNLKNVGFGDSTDPYTSDVYGAAFGNPDAAWIKIDPTNGVRIGHDDTTKIALDPSGGASFEAGDVTIDEDGIRIAVSTSSSDTSAYLFGLVGDTANGFGLYGHQTGSGATTARVASIIAEGSNGSPFPYYSAIRVRGQSSPQIELYVQTGGAFSLASTLTHNLGGLKWGVAATVTIPKSDDVALLTAANTFTAFGANAFSAGGTGGNFLTVANPTSGTGNYAALTVEAGTNTTSGLYAYSQGYTTTGQSIADSLQLFSSGAGGLNFTANHGSGRMRFKVASNLAFEIDANGDVVSPVDGTNHIGVPSRRFAYMTALAFNLTDMSLDNGWSLTEAERIGIAEPGVALVDDTGALVAFFGRDRFYTKKPADVDDLPYAVTTLEQRIHMDRTPEIRIKGYDPAGHPIFKTAADVPPMPDPAKGKTNTERKALRG